MKHFWNLMALGYLAVLYMVLVAFLVGFVGWYLPLLLVLLCAAYGWVAFAFFHYRYVRQEELLHLLTTAAESGAPLAPALLAYLRDRPRASQGEFWLATLLLLGY